MEKVKFFVIAHTFKVYIDDVSLFEFEIFTDCVVTSNDVIFGFCIETKAGDV